MSPESQHVLDAVLELPPDQRIAIADRIYESIPADSERETAAIREVETRIDAYYRGEENTIPAEEVLSEFLGTE